ncbi:MAG: heparin lyase I family protein, partial [Gemmatimonadota bacterium]
MRSPLSRLVRSVLVCSVPIACAAACGEDGGGDAAGSPDAGHGDGAPADAHPPDSGSLHDGGTDSGSSGTGPDGDAGGSHDGGDPADGGHEACGTAGIEPMIAHDMTDGSPGDEYLTWRRSTYDETHALSGGRSVRVRTDPGDELLPACSGSHYFAGRTALPDSVPEGRTIWYRAFFYLPDTFSMGHKYGGSGDSDAAAACDQNADGNRWIKWLVLAPHWRDSTARIYMMPSGVRRAVYSPSPEIRLISEALHRPFDGDLELPRNRWFALQIAVRVSGGDEGFIRGWIDDEFIGEVSGRTTADGVPLQVWGLGDYWNGVPWTDGEPGRTDFWVDDVIVASDAEGYAP